jgi:hypothetical protein
LVRPRALNDLYNSRRFGKIDEIRAWAAGVITHPALLMPFLRAFVTTSHSWGMSDHVAKVSHSLAVKYIADFVDLEELSARLRDLDPSLLTPADEALIAEFEDRRSRVTAGGEEDEEH